LVLIGDGPLKLELTQLIDELSLNECVLLPGFKQYEELPAYYGLSGAFIHSSKTEPWGLVVNEAMASGLPVIVSERCGCASDLVENGCNGFTFNPYDIDELAGLMLKVASDDCNREAMGQASREIISSWTPELFAENVLRAADAAMSAPQRPPRPWDRALLTALAYR
jgi:glycosyltransferase involved in cell wall biosynthesis